MLKIALAAQVATAADPAQLRSGLNHTLCGKFQGHYVNAALRGHRAPSLVGKGSTINRRVALPFDPGDRALLYTDGIPETTNPFEVEFGARRVRKFLAAE
jgi:phosphoserine phosphatase RsbU/P